MEVLPGQPQGYVRAARCSRQFDGVRGLRVMLQAESIAQVGQC